MAVDALLLPRAVGRRDNFARQDCGQNESSNEVLATTLFYP